MKTILITSLLFLLVFLTAGTGNAQSKKNYMKKRSPEFYIGPEFLAGAHNFVFRSDIDVLQNLQVRQSGTSFGAVAGHRTIRARLRKGQFQSENFVNEKVRTTTVEGSMSIFPLQFASRKFRSFEPYAIFGVSRSQYRLFGNYVTIQAAPPKKQQPCTCPCLCGTLPADPDADALPSGSDTVQEPERLPAGSDLGLIITRDLFAGLGMEAHIQRKGFFVNLFAEANYGLPKKVSITNFAFQNTNIVSPLIMRVGISAGLSK
jgi:hypothetical protein